MPLPWMYYQGRGVQIVIYGTKGGLELTVSASQICRVICIAMVSSKNDQINRGIDTSTFAYPSHYFLI